MKKLIIILTVLLLMGCKTKYIPVEVEKIHTEYVYVNKQDSASLQDSIYIHDSVYVKEKGDTLYYYNTKTEYKFKTQYKYISQKDTVCIKDTIPEVKVVTEYVEVNKLTWLQKCLIYLGGFLIVALIGFLGFKIFKLYTQTWKKL